MDSINIGNPIVFGLIAGVITYLILYLDINYENKKINININKQQDGKCYCPKLILSLKVPLIIGAIVWAAANYFDSDITDETFINDYISSFEQELFTDQPDF